MPRLDYPELSDIYLRLKLDTPLLFYVTGFQYRWMPGAPCGASAGVSVRQGEDPPAPPGGGRPAGLSYLAACREKSDRDKELSIHAFILENVRYDKLKKPYSHEIIYP